MATLVEKARAFAKDYRNGPDRLRNKIGSWRELRRPAIPLRNGFSKIELDNALRKLFPESAATSLRTLGLLAIRASVNKRAHEMTTERSAFAPRHNGTETLADLCYIACRTLRPRLVVETGVAHGVTSAHILKALSENGEGRLYSIDLPPLGSNPEVYVGRFVPEELRGRWSLRLGSAQKLLPEVLRQCGAVDVFIHDSLHTYAHMKWEFAQAMAALRPGGVLIADDIEGNKAFEEAAQDRRVASWFALEQDGKSALCGAIRLTAA
jgi:predicted O-methyltransferase YrrM